MLIIAKRQILEGLRDSKFLFLTALILLAFIANGVVFSARYRKEVEDYNANSAETHRMMQRASSNLQEVGILLQLVLQRPSELAFVADGGERFLPNAVQQNAFMRYETQYQHRSNEIMPVLPALDWTFIVGSLMTLLAVMVTYNALAEERQSGTLRLLLANSVSRLSIFAGKYLGLLAVLLSCLVVGVLLDLGVIALLGGPPLHQANLLRICSALLLAVLATSAFVLIGMAVSALTRVPAVALVVLLVIWVLSAMAVPGMARLLAEQLLDVPSQTEVATQIENKLDEIEANSSPGSGNWYGNPFHPHVVDRYKRAILSHSEMQKIYDAHLRAQIDQALLAQRLAASPTGLVSNTLQAVATTGVYGTGHFLAAVETYRGVYYQFLVDEDKGEPDDKTPHLVFGYRAFYFPGVFSQKSVPFDSIPKAEAVLRDLYDSRPAGMPLGELLALLCYNLAAGLAALITVLRVDPR